MPMYIMHNVQHLMVGLWSSSEFLNDFCKCIVDSIYFSWASDAFIILNME